MTLRADLNAETGLAKVETTMRDDPDHNMLAMSSPPTRPSSMQRRKTLNGSRLITTQTARIFHIESHR